MKSLVAMLSIVGAVVGAEEEISFHEIHVPSQEIRIQEIPLSIQDLEVPDPILPPPHKSPFIAVGLSYLFPGLGHVYLGDMMTAGGLGGSAGAELGLALASKPESPLSDMSLITLQNTWGYSLYATYRDVRLYNGNAGYKYKMPTDSFKDLTSAPFRWSVMKKPEVWGGLLAAFALAAGITYLTPDSKGFCHAKVSTEKMMPALALPIGVGEEALFRGFLQSRISEATNVWGGIAISSLLFGAAHLPNALLLEKEERWSYYSFGIPFITLFGGYFGWMTYKNQSLKESVALHTWYDFALFGLEALLEETVATRRPGFRMALPF